MSPPAPIVAVVGATATGKSDLGVALAQALGGEVVNADASQFYRGMDIGTAKLPIAQRCGLLHHLLDVLDVRDEASAAAYQRDSRLVMQQIENRGRRPVLVGGSGLYVRAALDDLQIPPTEPQVRAEWEAALAARGVSELYAELAQRDPEAAAQILPTNGRRIVRALEVIQLTGRPFSATMPRRQFLRPAVMIGLRIDRPTLHDRIEERVARMWADGLPEEVRGLEAAGIREGRTASRAIGYAQALAQLDGHLTQDEAQAETAALTRKFAKRQDSWFGADPRINWLPYDDPRLLQRALEIVDQAGRTQ